MATVLSTIRQEALKALEAGAFSRRGASDILRCCLWLAAILASAADLLRDAASR
jgi:hypothetical protein